MTPKELKARLAAGEDLSGTMYNPNYPLPPNLLNKITLILIKHKNN